MGTSKSDFAVLRIPVPLKIGDERGAEVAKGLLAGVDGAIAAEKIERLLADAERSAIAERAHWTCARQAGYDALYRGIHSGGRRDLVADEPAFRAVA